MKLVPVYAFMASKLQAIEGLKATTWFNGQDEEKIPASPVVMIQFPEPVPLESLARNQQKGPIRIRVTVFTKLITGQSGNIEPERMNLHEDITDQVYAKLHGYGSQEAGINSLERIRIHLDMRKPGWAKTHQDFTCEITSPGIPNTTPNTQPTPQLYT